MKLSISRYVPSSSLARPKCWNDSRRAVSRCKDCYSTNVPSCQPSMKLFRQLQFSNFDALGWFEQHNVAHGTSRHWEARTEFNNAFRAVCGLTGKSWANTHNGAFTFHQSDLLPTMPWIGHFRVVRREQCVTGGI